MDRTESIVVSVSPAYENHKIQEMSAFGWNLMGRQEVIGHLREVEAPTLGAAVLEGAMSTVRVQHDHYVKLHFARDLSLPNLNRIHALEEEYFALPRPDSPALLPGGCFLVLFWWPFWPLYYLLSYRTKQAAAALQHAETTRRAEEIHSEVSTLTT